jgi:hypothetical protein
MYVCPTEEDLDLLKCRLYINVTVPNRRGFRVVSIVCIYMYSSCTCIGRKRVKGGRSAVSNGAVFFGQETCKMGILNFIPGATIPVRIFYFYINKLQLPTKYYNM